MAEYNINSMVDTPPKGYARVEAFLTAKSDAVYAIVPRRPMKEVVIDDVEAPNRARVTLLEGGQSLESTVTGKQLRIRIPDALSANLPHRQAYTFKLAGVR